MIYTVTCNPSLDYRMELETLRPGKTNRAQTTALAAGGKGLNVSAVLHTLGVESRALGFAAGFVGEEIQRRMEEMGCCCQFVQLPSGCSRINVKLQAGDTDTEMNAPGPDIPAEAQAALETQLAQLQDGDTLVLAGSLPDSMPKTTYGSWLAKLTEKNIQTVVDTAGEPLLHTLAHRPFLIKPNHHELGALFNVSITTQEQAADYGQKLRARGAQNVLVSMSSKGAILCAEDGSVYIQPPAKGQLIHAVGAGDSMIAGFLAGWLRTGSYAEALHLGAAAGAATAFSPVLGNRDAIEAIAQNLPMPQRMA